MKNKKNIYIAGVFGVICFCVAVNGIIQKFIPHDVDNNIQALSLINNKPYVDKLFQDIHDNIPGIMTKEDKADKEILVDYKESDIINFDAAFENFSIPANPSRKIDIQNFSNDFPIELQMVLIQHNDNVEEGNDDWKQYVADCITITAETANDIPFEEIVTVGHAYPASTVQVIDIDGDGTDEYIMEHATGTGKFSRMEVVKYIDEWIIIGGGGFPNSEAINEILEFNGKYYLLLGNELACWKDDVSIDDWERYEAAPGQAPCWNRVVVKREVIDHSVHMIYSDGIEGNTIHIPETINLEVMEENGVEKGKAKGNWLIDGRSFDMDYMWKQEYEGEMYEFVTASISSNRYEDGDRVLLVLKDQKIVKVYYLAANYSFQLEDK